MKELTQLLSLLQDKKALFIEFEQCTEEMLTCHTDSLEDILAQREQLIGKIDKLDEAMDRLAEGSRELQQAVKCQGCPGDFSPETQEVYAAAAQVQAVISRMTEVETQVSLRLRLEQERILERIKSTNRGAGAQAARFLSTENVSQTSTSRAKV